MNRGTLIAVVVWLSSASAHAGCGDRGGPGYRGPDGKCVGWSALAKICGNPATSRCTAEKAHVAADEAAAHGSKIKTKMDDAHERAHRKDR